MDMQEMKSVQAELRRRCWQLLGDFRWPLLVVWLGAFAGGVACARCRILDVFMPAGLAWAAVWGISGVGYLPACLGLMTVWIANRQGNMILPLVVLSVLVAIRSSVPLLSDKRWTGFACLGLAGLLPLLSVQLPLELLLELWNLGLSLALFAAFCVTAERLRESGTQISAEVCVCAALGLGAILGGLPRAQHGIFDAAGLVVSFVILLCARLHGAGTAGAAGLASGLALFLSGNGDPTLVCILGGAGLAAGSLRPAGLFGVALGYAACAVSLDVLLTGTLFHGISWQALAGAEFAFLVLPGHLWRRHLQPSAAAHSLPAAVDSREASARLARFADCFRELAGMFEGENSAEENLEDAMPLLEHVAQTVCSDCPRRQICWKKEFSRTVSDLWTAARVQEEDRRILWEEDFPAEFAESCLQLGRVTEELRKICGAASLRHKLRAELLHSRELVGRQLSGVARVMEQLSEEMNWSPVPREDQVKVLRSRLKARGIPVHGVHVVYDASGRCRVRLVADACSGDHRCLSEILPIVQSVLGVPMQWQPCACGGQSLACRLTFVQSRVLGIQSSALQWAASGTCGDACMRLSLGDRGYLLALSDGMGVGEAAARESRRLMKLVEEFYRAGFEEELIFRTINEMLLLRPKSETFATLDICLVDLIHAKAHFVKLGAAPSYVVREDRPIMIASSSLPMGIVEEMQPFTRSMDLLPGDVIVLGSDGIVGSGEVFAEKLSCVCHLPVERMSRILMEDAEDRSDLRPDDRTLLAARITASHSDRAQEYKNRRMMRWKARVS